MGNKLATALLGAGAFSLAFAGLVPLVVTPALLKAPSEINLVTHSRSQAQVLNKETLKLEPKTVELTRTLTTYVKDGKFVGDADVAVYHETLVLAKIGADGKPEAWAKDDPSNFIGLQAGESVVAFDRKTGVALPDYKGIQGFKNTQGKPGTIWKDGQTVKFPFGTKTEGADGKGVYDLYDQTSRKAWPVKYTRTTTVKGLKVYEFKGTIPTTPIGQFGALVGTQTFYKNTGRTILVEPVTGSIVSQTTSPQTKFAQALGNAVQTLAVEELVPTDATVAERVATAKDSKSKALTLQRAPWVLGVLGLLLFLSGLFLLLRRRGDNGRPDAGAMPSQRTEPVGLSKTKH